MDAKNTKIRSITVTLTNDFHNSSSTVRLLPCNDSRYSSENYRRISRRTAQRVERKLCGISGCTCSDTFGARGGNYLEICNELDNRDYVIDLRASYLGA